MASSREFLEYIREQLSDTEDIAYRAMMGEFIIYCRGRIIGGIYDDRFLVKPTATARAMMPTAEYQLPYPGAKEMLAVDNVDDRVFLNQLVNAIADELPLPRRKRK
ncbi:MAG: TfoX/Sxy family protein [Erysipelotrichaceae bacterium]|nr:TfoX/Sxy family protein [Erysipelotrichaceae bacterium]